MNTEISRRAWLSAVPSAVGVAALAHAHPHARPAMGEQPPAAGPDRTGGLPASFPAQDPRLVREIVGASHGNIARVRELLEMAPQLAGAAYDWGFGDWETALGAASHTGRREIAALLMQRGARPDVFTFAMLGNLEAVKAMVGGSSELRKLRGPHGITLLSHARQGGEQSAAVVEYLTSLGDADTAYTNVPLRETERAVYLGSYAFGTGAGERLKVTEKNGVLWVQRDVEGGVSRGLSHQGAHEFHPAGAPDVRLMFTVEGGTARRVTVTAPAPLCVAERAE